MLKPTHLALALLLATMAPVIIGLLYDSEVVALLTSPENRINFERVYLGGSIIFFPFFLILFFVSFTGLTLLFSPRQQPASARLAPTSSSAPPVPPLPVPSCASMVPPPTVPANTANGQAFSTRTLVAFGISFCGLALMLCGPVLFLGGLTMQVPIGSELDMLAFQIVRYAMPLISCFMGMTLAAIGLGVGLAARCPGTTAQQKDNAQ